MRRFAAVGEHLDAAGIGPAIDRASDVAQAHAAYRETGALARFLAGLILTIVGTDDGDVALGIQYDTALGAQAGTGDQDVAILRPARGIARAVPGRTNHDIARGAQRRTATYLAVRVERAAALAAAVGQRHPRRRRPAVTELLRLGFGGTCCGHVLDGVHQGADNGNSEAALLERVLAVGVLDIAAGHDCNVLALDIDVARAACDFACSLARHDVAAGNQDVPASRHDDVSARGAQEAARVALRHPVDGLQCLGIAALV